MSTVSRALALATSSLTLAALTLAQQPTLLRDVNPGQASSTRSDQGLWLHPNGNFGILRLDDGTTGEELWRTDGTAAGTRLLFDFAPGQQPASVSTFHMAVDQDIWFVEVNTGVFGPPPSVWRTDGSSPTPVRVLDGATAGVVSFAYGGAAVDGDGLVFVRTANFGAWELWRVDAQGNHQSLWTDQTPTGNGAFPFFIDAMPGMTLFVDGAYRMHLTDGTPGGTVQITQGTVFPYFGRALGGFLFREQVTLPGPLAGTRVTVVRPGTNPIVRSFPTRRISALGLGDLLWIMVDDRDLLVIDGSGIGRQIATFVPSADPNSARNLFGLVDLGTTKLFFADGGNGAGRELWRSDGTAAGTVMVRDLLPGSADFPLDTVVQASHRMVFWGDSPGLGSEPWSSDGTAAGTIQLGDLEPGPGSSTVANMFWPRADASLLAIRTSAHGLEPWYCDGTPQGTRLARDIWPGPNSSLTIDPFSALFFGSVVGDRALFPANDGTHGMEFWTLPLPAYAMPHAVWECGRSHDLEIDGWPQLGNRIELQMRGLAPADRGAVVASLPGQAALLTVEGCGVHVDAATALTAGVVVPNASGSWSTPLTVPNQTALIGTQLAFQAAMLDSGSPLGWRPGKPWRVTLGR